MQLNLKPGQFSFTYNRGHGECKYPVSKIKSCTEDTRMILNFQACPDVEGTESTGESAELPLSSAFIRMYAAPAGVAVAAQGRGWD